VSNGSVLSFLPMIMYTMVPMNQVKKQDQVIAKILDSYHRIGGINHLDGTNLPSRESVSDILKAVKEILFPGYFEQIMLDRHNLHYVTGQKVVVVIDQLSLEIAKSFSWQEKTEGKPVDAKAGIAIEKKARDITYALMDVIPELRQTLKEDVAAIYQGDPAAGSEPEIFLSYPGFHAIVVYRISHFLFEKKVPLIPRIMSENAHSQTGIDIHPGAKIGKRFCIDHGTGVVIGQTAVIGDNVKLYQGVTIGALSVPDRKITGKRHPTLKDHVTVYARTTILGGKTIIGSHSVIGGNVWITSSIPDHSKLYLSEDRKQVLTSKKKGGKT